MQGPQAFQGGLLAAAEAPYVSLAERQALLGGDRQQLRGLR